MSEETTAAAVKPGVTPGYKSTEFWVTALVTVAGLILASGVVSEDSQAAKMIGGGMALAAQFGYTAARAWVKGKAS